MPRKRKTKLTKRTKPKLPDGDDPHDMSENERKEKLELFLQDFDLEVESRIENMRKEAEKICAIISSTYRMEIFKLPKNMRNMKRSEFLAKGGSVDAVALEQVSQTVDSLASSLVSSLTKPTNRKPLRDESNTTTTAKTTTEPDVAEAKVNESSSEPSIIEISIKEEVTTSPDKPGSGKKRKRGKRTTVAKGRPKNSKSKDTSSSEEQNNSLMPPPAPATVRRSARKPTLKNAFITPAMHTGRHNALTSGWDTPAVTPKFDPRLPVTPAVMRVPKAGERIMSMAGSPLSNPSHKGARLPEAYIPLPDGKAIQLTADQDVADVNNLEVNDTTRQNLILLQEKISKILQQKPIEGTGQ
ncbi:borealin-like [Ptychodera flava]|uniref:borealin-like n=1 Tax=Ptychodera flava TaxID=63121 RepID=UPI00396A213B